MGYLLIERTPGTRLRRRWRIINRERKTSHITVETVVDHAATMLGARRKRRRMGVKLDGWRRH